MFLSQQKKKKKNSFDHCLKYETIVICSGNNNFIFFERETLFKDRGKHQKLQNQNKLSN